MLIICLVSWVQYIYEGTIGLLSTLLPPDVRGAFVGAVVGAVGAYWVSQKTLRKEKASERWKRHRNSHQKLQLLLNEHLSMNSDNNYISKTIIKIDNVDEIITYFAWKKPHRYPSDFNDLSSFLRIELINELFSYLLFVRKINNDITTISLAYEEMRNAFLNKNITNEQYRLSFQEYKKSNMELIKGYGLLGEKTDKLLASVRVAIKKDEKLDKKYFKKLPELFKLRNEDIQNEKDIINQEKEKISNISRQQLDKHGI